MDTQHLTHIEVWDDFYQSLKRDGVKIPNAVAVAELTRRGKQLNGDKPKNLGVKRVLALIEKYAPGKYTFHEAHFTKA